MYPDIPREPIQVEQVLQWRTCPSGSGSLPPARLADQLPPARPQCTPALPSAKQHPSPPCSSVPRCLERECRTELHHSFISPYHASTATVAKCVESKVQSCSAVLCPSLSMLGHEPLSGLLLPATARLSKSAACSEAHHPAPITTTFFAFCSKFVCSCGTNITHVRSDRAKAECDVDVPPGQPIRLLPLPGVTRRAWRAGCVHTFDLASVAERSLLLRLAFGLVHDCKFARELEDLKLLQPFDCIRQQNTRQDCTKFAEHCSRMR